LLYLLSAHVIARMQEWMMTGRTVTDQTMTDRLPQVSAVQFS